MSSPVGVAVVGAVVVVVSSKEGSDLTTSAAWSEGANDSLFGVMRDRTRASLLGASIDLASDSVVGEIMDLEKVVELGAISDLASASAFVEASDLASASVLDLARELLLGASKFLARESLLVEIVVAVVRAEVCIGTVEMAEAGAEEVGENAESVFRLLRFSWEYTESASE